MLMALGENQAAEVFKHLNTTEIQRVSLAISTIRQISNDELIDVLSQFEETAVQFTTLNINTDDYLRSVLIKSLGEEKATSLLDDIFDSQDPILGIESLNYMDPQTVADIIRDEHPQIITTILVHLKRNLSAEILSLFEENHRNDIILRIATFGGVQPAALDELTAVLSHLRDGQNLKRSKMGGIKTAAEIINLLKNQQEESVINAVREYDSDLAQHIIDEMFLFENLIETDSRSIQRILQEVSTDSLVIALKGSSEPLREHFLQNMPTRTAEIVREDLDASSPVRMSLVESEQKSILLIVRRLVESGEIIIGGDDIYV